MNKYLYISFLIIILFSCKRKEETYDLGGDYFPIRSLGSYIIYDVERITYQASGKDTSRYQLKEEAGDTAWLNGKLYYKVLRYTRSDTSVSWPSIPDSVWYQYNNNAQAVKTENNRSFIKLVFPVEENKTWNGNALNIYSADNYTMENVGRPYTVAGHYFPATLKVVQEDAPNLVNEDQRYEVYAKGIGLIEKYSNTVLFCSEPQCIYDKTHYNIDSIIGGVRYKQIYNCHQ
jgi:hypothetical protein